MLHVQKMPKMYYAYVFFPVYFWNHILRNYRSLLEALRLSLANGFARFTIIGLASVFFLEALVRILYNEIDSSSLISNDKVGW
jgi:phosphatidylinositol glycan class N